MTKFGSPVIMTLLTRDVDTKSPHGGSVGTSEIQWQTVEAAVNFISKVFGKVKSVESSYGPTSLIFERITLDFKYIYYERGLNLRFQDDPTAVEVIRANPSILETITTAATLPAVCRHQCTVARGKQCTHGRHDVAHALLHPPEK
jgi:hypothetical protein